VDVPNRSKKRESWYIPTKSYDGQPNKAKKAFIPFLHTHTKPKKRIYRAVIHSAVATATGLLRDDVVTVPAGCGLRLGSARVERAPDADAEQRPMKRPFDSRFL
jgi:hypothetical protein